MGPQVRVTSDLFTVEIGVESSFSFDRAGCLVRALWDERLSRWGLDGACLQKPLRPDPQKPRQTYLEPTQGLRIAAKGYERAAVLLGQLTPRPGPPWDAVLTQVAEHGVQLMQLRAERFANVYEPVGIMPPDQYGALLLQLTVGCRYNRCRFCTFYRGRSYREKSLPEFQDHFEAVLDLVGPAIDRRRAVFLGDANALGLPFARLLPAFELMRARLPQALADVYTFMDVFGKATHTVDQFESLRRLGLRRVYIGAESGSAPVLRALGKPNTPERIARVVETLKAAGVAVGLVFLLGAGGQRFAAAHAEGTAALLSRLPLDGHDVVYLSELVVDPGSEYAEWAEQHHVVPLSVGAMCEQEGVMRAGLRPVGDGGPACTRYDVREFVYY